MTWNIVSMFSNCREIVSSIDCVPFVFFNSAIDGSTSLPYETFATVALH